MKHTRRLALLMALMLMFTMLPAAYAEAVDEEEGAATPMIEEELSSDEAAAAAGVEMEPFAPEDMIQKAIIGIDNRITVDNPSVYPYSAIAYLKVTAECGCSWSGSGFMVGPDAMMTAAHCVVCSEHGKTAEKITAYFGYTSEKNYLYKYSKGTTYWYNTNYDYKGNTTKNIAWDYAYIKLKERVGDKVGWFAMRAESDDVLDFSAFELAGYRDGVLKTGWGMTNVENEYIITYTNDTLPGNSGSPVFTDDYYVVAVHIASREGGKNVGRRITSTLLNSMRKNGMFD